MFIKITFNESRHRGGGLEVTAECMPQVGAPAMLPGEAVMVSKPAAEHGYVSSMIIHADNPSEKQVEDARQMVAKMALDQLLQAYGTSPNFTVKSRENDAKTP